MPIAYTTPSPPSITRASCCLSKRHDLPPLRHLPCPPARALGGKVRNTALGNKPSVQDHRLESARTRHLPRETSCPIPVIGGCGSSQSQRLTASSRRPWKRPASSTKLQSVERAGGVSQWLLYVGVDHRGLQTILRRDSRAWLGEAA